MLRKLLCFLGYHDIVSYVAKHDWNGMEEGFHCKHCNKQF